MDAPLAKVDRAALRAQLLAEFERTVDAVVDAVDSAPAGRVIRDSEEPARVALDRFRCQVYEAVLQAKVEEWSRPPVPRPLAQRRGRKSDARRSDVG